MSDASTSPEIESSKPEEPSIFTVKQLAAITETSQATIRTKLEALKVPYQLGARGVHLYSLADLLGQFFKHSKVDRANDPHDNNDKNRLTKFKADLAELQLMQRQSELILASEALTAITESFGEVRTALLNLGPSVARQLAITNDPEEIARIIDLKLEQALESLKVPVIQAPEGEVDLGTEP